MWGRTFLVTVVGLSLCLGSEIAKSRDFTSLLPNPYNLDLRYHATPTHKNVVDETGSLHSPLLPWLSSDLVVRLSQDSGGLREFSYLGELGVTPLSFFDFNFRILHSLQLADTTSATTFLPYFRLHLAPVSFLTVFGSFGWYERLLQISKAVILPTPWRNDVKEDDFAGEFGFQFRTSAEWTATFKLATFENLDVFNLNNPFAETDLQYCPTQKNYCAMAYGRYQVLLGFGDLDELMFGVGVSFKNPFEK